MEIEKVVDHPVLSGDLQHGYVLRYACSMINQHMLSIARRYVIIAKIFLDLQVSRIYNFPRYESYAETGDERTK